MAEYTFGMAKILLGTPAGDGGMSTTLTEKFGYTKPDSVSITSEEGTKSEIFIEESDTAIISQDTPGAKRVNWSTYNTAPEALQAAFGGTIVGTGAAKVWNSPENLQPVIYSVRIEDKANHFWAMAKVQVVPRLNININKSDAGQIDFVGTILIPDKAGVSPIVRGYLS
ncbi:hypothetical protein AHMF7605_11795 [Adhaeribacter arboris]|uniref:Phage tail protein n=1 Tax=Adhaeribacter arboris TaxID=2072846 RepID=A0A2T2YF76_9BACT|nr:hypothetical protein [Adhaeribacter arboris]PSR54154.1 hypothetical protein AHMF7605_11795 [Adhaeribacter arboris]